MKNPYLDLFNSLPDSYKRRGELLTSYGERGRSEEYRTERERICSEFSWSVPTEEAILAILDWSRGKVFDFGSGSGYWGWMLANAGCEVTCMDNNPPDQCWTSVDLSGAPTSDQALMIGWPVRGDMSAYFALAEFKGDRIIYVGEILRGCGEIEFFGTLLQYFEIKKMIDLPQWWNRCDKVYLLERQNF